MLRNVSLVLFRWYFVKVSMYDFFNGYIVEGKDFGVFDEFRWLVYVLYLGICYRYFVVDVVFFGVNFEIDDVI